MLHVLRPRLGAHGHAVLCRPKGAGSGCARRGRRRLSTTSEPSKPAGSPGADEEPGWPLKYKVAGGAALGTIIPWMFSYAVANDPGSRRLVAKLSPGLVQWFRNRQKGGHFFDEDPKRVQYLAQAPEWIDQPVTMEVRTGSGESRLLKDLSPQTPFSRIAPLVREDGSGGGRGSGGMGAEERRGWLTDFEILDEGDTGDGEGPGRQASWDTKSSSSSSSSSDSSSYDDDDGGGSTYGDATRRAVAACNIRSWWDIAAMEDERARQPKAPTVATAAVASPSAAARGGSGSASAGMAVGAATQAKKMTNAEQAQAMIEHLESRVGSLEQDKLTGARSVDDVEEEVRDLRKQQKELRRKYPGRRRFLGLF
eukprot:g5686.t1